MTKPADDLEAVRTIVETLEGFQQDEKERIIRWTLEKLNLPGWSLARQQQPPPLPGQPQSGPPPSAPATAPRNLRTFVDEKQPKSDVQFAAVVAFFHRFEALSDQRKENVNKDDLKEACRLVNRERLKSPLQTLNNARNLGLLDSAGRGLFTINSVGENLVAMTLPATSGQIRSKGKARAKKLERAKK